MLSRLSNRDRLDQLAQQAVESTGGGGESAWRLWERWVRDDAELMKIVVDEALRARAIATISAYARRERIVIKAGAGAGGETTMGAPLSPKTLRGLAGTAQLLLSHLTLPIPGNPRLCEATCAQVWDAIDYKSAQMRPARIDTLWWKMILGGRDRVNKKALTRKHTESKLIELRAKAERQIRI